MGFRPFAWPDLYTLFRNRRQVIPLDSAAYLTNGSPAGMEAALSHLNPACGVFTGIAQQDGAPGPVFGQVHHLVGERAAHLTYLAPLSAAASPAFSELLDGLAQHAGQMGAFNLLAEVDERSPSFEDLRMAGFTVYGWQQVWQLPPSLGRAEGGPRWQALGSTDEIPVRSLFQSLVPPLVQSAEALPARLSGQVCRLNGDLMAYLDCSFGTRGIYLTPLIHPALETPAVLLRDLERALAPLLNRPLYVCVRTHQTWLEPALEEVGAQAAPRQALMIRRLAAVQWQAAVSPALGAVRRTETTPLAHLKE